MTQDDGTIRAFETGATRDTAQDKLAYEGFDNPFVTHRFAEYMHEHRLQSDGSMRAADNWQKGIPVDAYLDSLVRHVEELRRAHRGIVFTDKAREDILCAIRFNVNGLIYESLQDRRAGGDRPA